MFTDHILFTGVAELLGVLVMLYSFAMSIRVRSLNRSLNPILLHPASGSWTPLNKFYFFAVRNCGARSLIDFRVGAHVARKNCNLVPAGRRASANGKEETSC